MSDDIFVGNVAVGIVPSAQGLSEKIRAQVVPSASGVGAEWGGKFNDGVTSRIGDVMSRWSAEQDAQAKSGGSKAGDTYASSFRQKIDAALRDIPPVELTANSTEAEKSVAKLRADLDELKGKEIGVDLTTTQATEKLDKIKGELTALRDDPTVAMVDITMPNFDKSLAKITELRDMASKPIITPVEVVSKGGTAAFSGLEKDAEKASDSAGASWGSNFMSKITGFFGGESEKISGSFEKFGEKAGEAGKESAKDFGGAFSNAFSIVSKGPMVAAAAAAVVVIAAVMGEKLQLAQDQLEQTLKNTGGSWDQYAGQVSKTGTMMAKYGYTQDQVDNSIRSVLTVTHSMSGALQAQGVIADIAAAKHIDLTAATKLYTSAAVGNTKVLKQLGDTVATGATQTAAMKKAQGDLADQISAAGGMAQFAAQHHISLSKAQELVSGATKGNIKDMNELGIVVMPTSISAADRLAQINRTVTASMGGQAQTVADSFGGKIRALRATFIDWAEALGTKILPYLNKLVGYIQDAIPWIEKIGGEMIKLAAPIVSAFFKGLGDLFHVMFGPLKDVTLGIIALAAAVTIVKLAILAFEAVTPFGWVLIAVAVIIVLIGIIDKFHKQILAVFTEIIGWIRSAWSDVWNWVAGFFEKQIDAVTGVFSKFVGWLRSAFSDIINWIKQNWMLVAGIILAGVTLGFSLVVVAIIKYHNQIMDLFKDLISWIRSAWSAVWSWVSSFFAQIWDGIRSQVTNQFNWLRGAFKDVIDWIRSAWSNVWNWVSQFFKDIWNKNEQILNDAFGWTKRIFNDTLGWIRNLWNSSWSAVSNFMGGVWNGIMRGVGTFWTNIKHAFSDGVAAIKSIWAGIENAIKTPMTWLVNTVYNNGIVKIVDGIAGVFGQHPLNPVNGFAGGTGGAPPGWAWVGEQGPELVNMRGGETVLTTQQSMATGLWGSGRGFATGTGPAGQTPAVAVPGSPAAAAAAINAQTQKEQALLATENSDPVGKPIVTALKNLVGKALQLGLEHAVDPLINAVTGKFPGKFGTDVKGAMEKPMNELIGWLVTQDQDAQGSGSEMSAMQFMVKQVGKRYSQASRYGPDSWDCSGLVWGASHQAGIPMPGGPGPNNAAAIVDPELQWVGAQAGASWTTDPKKIQAGDYLGFHASDQGTFGSAKMIDGDYLMVGKQKIQTMGHIGMATSPTQYVSAYDTAEGVIIKGIAGDRFAIAVRLGGGGSGPLGGATGNSTQNATEGFNYLRTNLFSGNAIAAAGAVASIYGESTWMPFSQGTGGRGLIGWTPPGSISNAAFNGGMKTQLPAIIDFVRKNGDMGAIAEMLKASSIFAAANIWGEKVERYGINDVHSAGIALAAKIAGQTGKAVTGPTPTTYNGYSYASGTRGAAPGWALVGEEGPEIVYMRGGEQVLTNEQSLAALSQMPGMNAYAAGTMMSGMSHDMKAATADSSLKVALRDVEMLLKANVKATSKVGGDVAAGINGKAARPAGNRAVYNNGMG